MKIKNEGTINIHVHPGIPNAVLIPRGLFGINIHSPKKQEPTPEHEPGGLEANSGGEATLPEPPAPGPIMERIKTFADVEAIAGRRIIRRVGETNDELAYRQVKLIAEVYNEGTVLDPSNTDQWKYYPWHSIETSPVPSGVGLSYDGYATWHTYTRVGVRLCFAKKEHAIDAGKKFIDIYTELKIR